MHLALMVPMILILINIFRTFVSLKKASLNERISFIFISHDQDKNDIINKNKCE
jgi:hypothetical protein